MRGRTVDDQQALIIWRDMTQVDNAALERFVEQHDFRIRDNEFDLIYVNGDTNLENMKQGNEIWKVRLIEEAFQRLMFDVQDV